MNNKTKLYKLSKKELIYECDKLQNLLELYKTKYINLKEIYELTQNNSNDKYIILNRNTVIERQNKCKEDIKLYERKYRYAREHNDTFYMKSYWRTINRLQSEFETLRWVLSNNIEED